ncbi:MAG: hypothetical protein PHC51_03670 [bacterium]|nr:hypothetical protein [bacterium]
MSITKLFKFIPSGRRALVSSPFSKEVIVDGPRYLPPWCNVRFFTFQAIHQEQRVSVYDETGVDTVINGPAALHIHPDGNMEPHSRFQLAENEAIVVIGGDGKQNYYFGGKVPDGNVGEVSNCVYVKPDEKLHTFCLTGGGDSDGLGKEPRHLRFQVVRLKPTQAYFSVAARTKTDQTPLIVKLMIYFKVSNLGKFTNSTDDPFGAMFNTIMTGVTKLVGTVTFDDFKAEPGRLIEQLMDNSITEEMVEYGLEISKIQLRGWMPEDRSVQEILNRAATINTKKAIDQAEHEIRMNALKNEATELQESGKNNELRRQMAEEEGSKEGVKIARLMTSCLSACGAEVNKDVVLQVIKLYLAGKSVGEHGGTLSVTPAMLSDSTEG